MTAAPTSDATGFIPPPATPAQRPRRRGVRAVLHPMIVASALIAVTPVLVLNDYYLGVASLALTYVVIGCAFNLLYGYLGMLSFAQVAFLGIGGYASAWMVTETDAGIVAALLVGGVVAGLCAAAVGVVTVRLSEGAFAIITLSLTLLCAVIAAGWTSVTGGRQGMFGLPAPSLRVGDAELVADTPRNYYLLLGFFTVGALWIMWRLVISRTGRVMIAIRDHEPLARAQGYATNRYKLGVLLLSATLTGLAGALHVFRLTTVDPSVFDFYLMQAMLIIVVLGGAGTFWPVVISAVVFAVLPEFLRSAEEWRLIIYGGLLVLGLLLLPQGVGGYLKELALRRRLGRTEGSA